MIKNARMRSMCVMPSDQHLTTPSSQAVPCIVCTIFFCNHNKQRRKLCTPHNFRRFIMVFACSSQFCDQTITSNRTIHRLKYTDLRKRQKRTAGSSPLGEELAVLSFQEKSGCPVIFSPKSPVPQLFPGNQVTGLPSGGGPGPSGGPRRRAGRFRPGGHRPGRPGCQRHHGGCLA